MIFTNYNPQSYPKMCRNFFVKTGNFFSAEFQKITFCHFWSDVMFRVWASRASPAPKLRGLLGYFQETYYKHFILFSFHEIIFSQLIYYYQKLRKTLK